MPTNINEFLFNAAGGSGMRLKKATYSSGINTWIKPAHMTEVAVLVRWLVGGGGGGGGAGCNAGVNANVLAGGGAGGEVIENELIIATGNLSCNVGAGGGGGSIPGSAGLGGGIGGVSTVDTLTARGGGGGASGYAAVGQTIVYAEPSVVGMPANTGGGAVSITTLTWPCTGSPGAGAGGHVIQGLGSINNEVQYGAAPEAPYGHGGHSGADARINNGTMNLWWPGRGIGRFAWGGNGSVYDHQGFSDAEYVKKFGGGDGAYIANSMGAAVAVSGGAGQQPGCGGGAAACRGNGMGAVGGNGAAGFIELWWLESEE